MGLLRVRHDWETSLSLFTFMHGMKPGKTWDIPPRCLQFRTVSLFLLTYIVPGQVSFWKEGKNSQARKQRSLAWSQSPFSLFPSIWLVHIHIPHIPEAYSHALEKEMATHSSVLAWRIPGTGEPGGLPSMGSHRVGHDWSDLAAAYIHIYIHVHIDVCVYIYTHTLTALCMQMCICMSDHIS